MPHLGATGRKAIATASQQFLNHATLLLEALRSIETQIQLQDTYNHTKTYLEFPDGPGSPRVWLKGCLGLFNYINLDNITGFDVVVILQADTTLVIIADLFDVIFKTTQ